jgi:hypothetical protein
VLVAQVLLEVEAPDVCVVPDWCVMVLWLDCVVWLVLVCLCGSAVCVSVSVFD